MRKLTHLQIYRRIYMRHMNWYKDKAVGVITNDEASRASNIFAVKNTNREWLEQYKEDGIKLMDI